jgi:hypothetical protein
MSGRLFVVTDFYAGDDGHRPYQGVLREPRTDREVSSRDAIAALCRRAGAEDGDEVEIIVRKTGRRPFGDRRVRLVAPHSYERERRSDMLRRLKGGLRR